MIEWKLVVKLAWNYKRVYHESWVIKDEGTWERWPRMNNKEYFYPDFMMKGLKQDWCKPWIKCR